MQKALVDTNVLIRLLIRDDDLKRKSCEKLLQRAKRKEIALYLIPVTILEIVWVLEKYYKLDRKTVRELVEAVLNTPELKCEMEEIFRNALRSYEEKKIKFADAVISYWALEKGFSAIYTYDEKDFKKIEGIEIKIP